MCGDGGHISYLRPLLWRGSATYLLGVFGEVPLGNERGTFKRTVDIITIRQTQELVKEGSESLCDVEWCGWMRDWCCEMDVVSTRNKIERLTFSDVSSSSLEEDMWWSIRSFYGYRVRRGEER